MAVYVEVVSGSVLSCSHLAISPQHSHRLLWCTCLWSKSIAGCWSISWCHWCSSSSSNSTSGEVGYAVWLGSGKFVISSTYLSCIMFFDASNAFIYEDIFRYDHFSAKRIEKIVCSCLLIISYQHASLWPTLQIVSLCFLEHVHMITNQRICNEWVRIFLLNIILMLSCLSWFGLDTYWWGMLQLPQFQSIDRRVHHMPMPCFVHTPWVSIFLFATPFWWGIYAWVSCFSFPSCSQFLRNFVDLYSPLSLCSYQILWSIWVSTIFVNTLNVSSALDLAFRKYVHSF